MNNIIKPKPNKSISDLISERTKLGQQRKNSSNIFEQIKLSKDIRIIDKQISEKMKKS